MKAANQLGRWTWRAPLGFLNGNTKAGEPSLLPDPLRAPLIRQAFELAAAGRSAREALRTVTAIGLQSKKGRPLTPQSFGALLRNPIYAGLLNAPGFGITGVHGDFRAVVPEVLFQRAQSALRRGKRTQSRAPDHPDFPLRRFVICGICDAPLTGSASRGRSVSYPYYHCRNCKGVRVRTAQLEAQFAELLETLQPRAEFMQLFREIVLDVWKDRGTEARKVQVGLESRISELRQREGNLEEAYLYQRRIDAETYERQRDKLREDLALARIELEDAKLEEVDIEGVLGFAEHLLTNAARLWIEAPSDQKRRLQAVFFPENIRLTDGIFGTAVTCMAFSQLREISASKEGMASPRGRARVGAPETFIEGDIAA